MEIIENDEFWEDLEDSSNNANSDIGNIAPVFVEDRSEARENILDAGDQEEDDFEEHNDSGSEIKWNPSDQSDEEKENGQTLNNSNDLKVKDEAVKERKKNGKTMYEKGPTKGTQDALVRGRTLAKNIVTSLPDLKGLARQNPPSSH